MRFLPLLLLAVRVEIPPAWACSCMPTDPVGAATASGLAYVGEIVSVEGIEDDAATGGCAGETDAGPVASEERDVEVRVVEAIHGGAAIGDTFTIPFYIGDQGGADCSLPAPEVGERWIFYGAGDSPITLCSPDQRYDEATAQALRDAFAGD